MSDDSPPLNFAALSAFIDEEKEDLDINEMHYWYEKLAEYDPEPNLSEKQLRVLFTAMQALANFSFTAEEALRDEIKREAEATADRESSLRDQLAATKEELDDIRDKMAVGADVGSRSGGESLEVIRAQVTALKEENYLLQQTNRERDRELADQRDRFESIMARAESLHRERDQLLYNRSQMEETLSDLKRKLISKTEGGEHEWEAKKLRQRNDQALQLSQQLNGVISQNDTLREEVKRVSSALEDATALIETTTHRYDDLTSRLVAASSRIRELEEDKERLEKELIEMREIEKERIEADDEEQLRSNYERTIQTLKSELAVREQEVVELRSSLSTMASRLDWAEAKADVGTEKEEQLEKLRVQLQRATKEAKSLLGYTPIGKDDSDSREKTEGIRIEEQQMRRSLIQYQHSLAVVQSQLNECRDELSSMERESEEKEKRMEELSRESQTLRELKLGDAATMLADMQRQMKFRDEQINRLTQQCSLLHIELGKYAQLEEEGRLVPRDTQKDSTVVDEVEDPAPRIEKRRHSEKKTRSEIKDQIEEKKSEDKNEEKVKHRRMQQQPPISRGNYEEEALLIANLYYESINLIEELESKETRLKEAEKIIDQGSHRLEECRAQLRLAYEHIARREEELRGNGDVEDERSEDIEKIRMENEQMKIFASTIREGGSEIERRAEEMNRKLIGENLERIRVTRRLYRLEKRLETEETSNRLLRERSLTIKGEAAMEIALLQRQLDEAWSEEARLQEMILQCVPRSVYSDIHSKYIHLLRSSSGLESSTLIEASSIDSIIPDILPRQSDEYTNEQMIDGLRRELEHTKRLLSIIEDQSSYYQGEAETLRIENNEMRRLLEQCENEGEAESILVSIETHLLRTLREQAESAREGIRAKEQLRKIKDQFRRLKGDRAAERRHLIAVSRLLHSTLERSQTETLHGISVSQVEQFRDKIGELMEKEERINNELQKAETARKEMEDMQRRIASMRETLDLINDSDGERSTLERAIHSLISRERETKERLNGAQAQIVELQSELRILRGSETSFEEERRIVLEQVGAFLELREARLDIRDNIEKERKEETIKRDKEREDRRQSIRLSGEEHGPTTEEESEESEQSFDSDQDEKIRSNRPRVVVKTVLHDNTSKYEEKLSQMKDTAEVCIRAYKDQLEEKERALNELRKLLEKKMNEVTVIEKVETVREIVKERDESMEKELEDLRRETAKMNRVIKELENANELLYEKTRKDGDIEMKEIYTQTESSTIREDTYVHDDSGREDSGRSYDDMRGGTMKSIDRRGDENDEIIKIKDQLIRVEEDLRKTTDRLKYERRTNKETISKLTIANKELSRACEEIKRAAMEEVREKMTGRGGDTSRQTEERLIQAREESESLRKTIDRLKKTIESMKKDYDEDKRNNSVNKVQVEQWYERKRLEETINRLKKDIKQHIDKEKTVDSELAKRDRRIAELESIDRTRMKSITQLDTQLRSIRPEKSNVSIEKLEVSDLRSKIRVLEEQLMTVRMELNESRLRNSRLMEERKEWKNTQSKSLKEIERKIEIENKEIKEKEKTKSVEKTEERKEIRELRSKLSNVQKEFKETKEKLLILQKEHTETIERHKLIVTRLEKDTMSISGIVLLNDKLQAKELEIRHLKVRISDMEKAIDKK